MTIFSRDPLSQLPHIETLPPAGESMEVTARMRTIPLRPKQQE
jgi:hypothetical protein